MWFPLGSFLKININAQDGRNATLPMAWVYHQSAQKWIGASIWGFPSFPETVSKGIKCIISFGCPFRKVGGSCIIKRICYLLEFGGCFIFAFHKLTFILTVERKLWPQILSRDFSYRAGIDERNRFIRFPIMWTRKELFMIRLLAAAKNFNKLFLENALIKIV